MKRFFCLAAVVGSVGLLAATPAIADEEIPAPPVDRPDTLSLTGSLWHLQYPMFGANVEVALGDRFGLAVHGALGVRSVDVDEGSVVRRGNLAAAEFGGSFRYYLIGDFANGMQLGLDMRYLTFDLAGLEEGWDAEQDGFDVGPFAGYKIVAPSGFTFEVQGGGTYFVARVQPAEGGGTTGAVDDKRFDWFAYVNFGWTF